MVSFSRHFTAHYLSDAPRRAKKWKLEIFPFVIGKEIQARWKNLRTCFKRELNAPKNATSGEGSKERRKYIYFDKLLFLLPHLEDRATQSNLSTQRNENEKANNSQ